MAWAAIDDGMPWHPKILALTPRERWTWISAICYSQRYRTRGHIPTHALAAIPDADHKTAAKLVEIGLWHTSKDGWEIHDYDDYNPERIQKNLRQRRWRDGKNDADVDANVDACVDADVDADVDAPETHQ